mmetsp:Transcript_83377/g.223036  ORF Transcript_83377/g.223036 Transcript_83377/m.223036 type:complete len:237 (-) Transcript_83377:493-1203(-)
MQRRLHWRAGYCPPAPHQTAPTDCLLQYKWRHGGSLFVENCKLLFQLVRELHGLEQCVPNFGLARCLLLLRQTLALAGRRVGPPVLLRCCPPRQGAGIFARSNALHCPHLADPALQRFVPLQESVPGDLFLKCTVGVDVADQLTAVGLESPICSVHAHLVAPLVHLPHFVKTMIHELTLTSLHRQPELFLLTLFLLFVFLQMVSRGLARATRLCWCLQPARRSRPSHCAPTWRPWR